MRKKIFISYAREDRETAKRIFEDLESRGLSPWIDEENLLPGQKWREAILQKIKASDYVLILMSKRSTAKRGFVQVEQKRALKIAEEFTGTDIFIIPARLDDCEIPLNLESYQYTNLFPDYRTGLDQIIQSLAAEKYSVSDENDKSNTPMEKERMAPTRDQLLKKIMLHLSTKAPGESSSLGELRKALATNEKEIIVEALDELHSKGLINVSALTREAMLSEITYNGRKIVKDF